MLVIHTIDEIVRFLLLKVANPIPEDVEKEIKAICDVLGAVCRLHFLAKDSLLNFIVYLQNSTNIRRTSRRIKRSASQS